MLRIVTVLVLY